MENSARLQFGEHFGEGQIGKQRETYCIEWMVCGSLDGLEKRALVGMEALQQG